MGSRDLLNKFTSGELDPKFYAEVDYDGYRKSARRLRNVVCLPQGGVAKRFGSIFQDIIEDSTGFAITNREEVRLFEYEHTGDQFFDIVIRSDSASLVAFDIYLDGVFQISVPAPPGTYQVADIRNIRWVKDYNAIFLLTETVRPYALRIITPNNWTLTPITFVFFPTYDFTVLDDPATLPTPNVPYTDPSVTFTVNAMNATMVTASTRVFTSNHVGGIFSNGIGIFRILTVNPAGTVATGFSIVEFADTAPINGTLAILAERAWNDGAVIGGAPLGQVRGWPGHGCFYQARLVLGGSTDLPGSVYASGIRDIFNFNDAQAEAEDSWGVEIGVTGNDVLADIIPTKSLVLLSNKGPASTSILLDSPTTPLNAFLNTQGTEGARNMNSVMIDNQILYADRAGNNIWSMSYELPDTGYNISNASILSTQLIRNPRWADIFDPDTLDGRYYLLVNDDGTMAIYNTLKDENIKAWTLAQTTGSYIDVACVANIAKTLVRRKIVTGGPSELPNAIYIVDSSFNAFRNEKTLFNTSTNVPIFVTNGDYLLIGNEIQFTQMLFQLTTNSSENLNLKFEFLTNTHEWEQFFPGSDATNGMLNSGVITWQQSQVDNWQSQVIPNTDLSYGEPVPYYWIRISRQNANTITAPISNLIQVNTTDQIYLEQLDFNVYMDCQIPNITSDIDGNITGLQILAGQNAFLFANGFPLQTTYIAQDGTANIIIPNATITAGLDAPPVVVPMPVVALLQNGYSVYEPVKVTYLYIDYYLSLGITVQGQNVPQISPGDFMTNEVPVPISGVYKIPAYGGWEPRDVFVITQSYPAPMTLLGISYTLEVSP